jgi:hypothetical protein
MDKHFQTNVDVMKHLPVSLMLQQDKIVYLLLTCFSGLYNIWEKAWSLISLKTIAIDKHLQPVVDDMKYLLV